MEKLRREPTQPKVGVLQDQIQKLQNILIVIPTVGIQQYTYATQNKNDDRSDWKPHKKDNQRREKEPPNNRDKNVRKNREKWRRPGNEQDDRMAQKGTKKKTRKRIPTRRGFETHNQAHHRTKNAHSGMLKQHSGTSEHKRVQEL